MKNAQPRTTWLKDYEVSPYLIDETNLRFELAEESTLVISKLLIRNNPLYAGEGQVDLVLDGQEMLLEKLFRDGRLLAEDEFARDEESLTVFNLPAHGEGDFNFTLECHTRIKPQENTTLEGLYKSKTMFCTQCEAEGFRKITYYLDRPDVMSKFTTTIVANKQRYPVLLSNGNAIARGSEQSDATLHWVTWEDPFKKPSYLFALVAGDLVCVEDHFITCSARRITLQIFVEEKDRDKCDHAMLSLKNAMAWDEKVFGREYDLDIFMIVAVDDFNMGAMENKGLNIFNTSCVLANPKTTTDVAFQRVEGVVAHEYFHNWSGNRVTCRDWFQLSLKEGFTVFRDSEFSADMGSRTVKRIEDISLLRTVQFAEDAGPMSHPITPASYMEISNFYTVTIYEKGAEVVRMISQLLGSENFRAGTDLYFNRHDGEAVTTEDFVKAMEDASGVDLGLFRNWYSQSGTPVVDVVGNYHAVECTYTLEFSQSCPATAGQKNKQPFHIPIRMGLLDASGAEIVLSVHGREAAEKPLTDIVLNITEPRHSFTFDNVNTEPVPSLLRGFSAPVKLNFNYTREQLCFLVANDTDGFNRWNASQLLGVSVFKDLIADYQADRELKLDEVLLSAYESVLRSCCSEGAAEMDKAMVAQLLTLPTEAYISEISTVIDVDAIHGVREFLRNALAQQLQQLLSSVYSQNVDSGEYDVSAGSIAQRSLKNTCLGYLMCLEQNSWLQACRNQFANANNMTDMNAALRFLVNSAMPEAVSVKADALGQFYNDWQDEPLVIDQWFTIQASCPLPGAIDRVVQLQEHPAFDIRNPNKVRSLIAVFCSTNAVNFHQSTGEGYEFLREKILQLNELNPQIASRLLTPMTRWRKYSEHRQQLMKQQLERIRNHQGLSKDVFEIVDKSLK